ncbi:MAG: XRE family transcriptional regulator, partial [Rhodoferax sp.]
LERGLKEPTLSKLEQLAAVMNVHPLALLALAYTDGSGPAVSELLARVEQELLSALAEVRN